MASAPRFLLIHHMDQVEIIELTKNICSHYDSPTLMLFVFSIR